jgi:hypothetical protein
MGRMNGGALGPSHDLREDEGHVPPSEVGGLCAHCSRSFIPRPEDEKHGDLCRSCARAARTRANVAAASSPEAKDALDALEELNDAAEKSGASKLTDRQIDALIEESRAERAEPPICDGCWTETGVPHAPWCERSKEKPMPEKKAALEPRRCALESCGTEFTPWRRDQRFHKPECSRAFHEADRLARKKEKGAMPENKPKKTRAPRPSSTATSSPRTSSVAALDALTKIRIASRLDEPVRDRDPEIDAIAALAQLDDAARARVLAWASSRYGA